MKKLSKITEGILGDIARRDLHGGTRKEDDINLLNAKEFEKYFQEHYERIYGGTIIEISEKIGFERISIPVIIFNYYEYCLNGYYDINGRLDNVSLNLPNKYFDEIKTKYPKLKELTDFRGHVYTYKGHKITNKDFLDIIDICILNSDHQIWKKK